MVTNDQIRRARPSVDSPLGRLLKGEISQKQYEQQVTEKRSREADHSRQSASRPER